MLIVNLKNYKFGDRILKLTKKLDKRIIVAASPVDISKIKNCFSQHVDYAKGSRNTGYILPEAIKAAGAKGSLINHSEHKLKFDEIKKTVNRCKEVKLKSVVCVANLSEAKKVLKLKPWAIAYEDPKLVGSGKSITDYREEELRKFVDITKGKVKVFCGAGINKIEDVEKAFGLGCEGVLVASVIAKSKNPSKFLKEVKRFL
tara:strand:+ start:276 stop:881 length:606 start_codon:yes stop_codon:yes gene_type:complete